MSIEKTTEAQEQSSTAADNGNVDRKPNSSAEQQTPGPQPAAQATVEVDESDVVAGYANFGRVSSTPEEVIMDLGVNTPALSASGGRIKVLQRIILNHSTPPSGWRVPCRWPSSGTSKPSASWKPTCRDVCGPADSHRSQTKPSTTCSPNSTRA